MVLLNLDSGHRICFDTVDHSFHMVTTAGDGTQIDLGGVEWGVDVSDRRLIIVSDFEDHTDWTVLSDSTTNKADNTTHVTGASAVSFDKAAAGETYAGITDTINALNLSEFAGQGVLNLHVYLSTIADVVSVEIRLGTDAANQNIWIKPVIDLFAGWNMISIPLGACQADLGNGWDDAAVTFATVLVNFGAAGDTLVGIIVDMLSVQSAKAVSIQVAVEDVSQAEDAPHTSGDKVVPWGTIRRENVHDPQNLAGATGDYQIPSTNSEGVLRAQAQQHFSIDDCNVTTDWSVLDDATAGLATDLNHVMGTNSLLVNKVDGSGGFSACIDRSIYTMSFEAYHKAGGMILYNLLLPDVAGFADIDYVFIRLGTDDANYNEWRILSDKLTAGEWLTLRFPIMFPSSAGSTGNGWNSASVSYLAVGVMFDAEDDTLDGIQFDHIAVNSGIRTTADLTADITTSIATPNINVHRMGGTPVATGTGATSASTQRVVEADDGPLVVATEAIEAAIADGTLTRTVINFTAGGPGTTEIVAAGSASLYVVAAYIMADTEIGLTINSDTVATQLTGIMPISARSGFILQPWKGTSGGWLKGDSTKNLTITVSAACDIDGFIVTRDLA